MDAILLKYNLYGNEYLVFDASKNNITINEKAVRVICSRNFGVGVKGLVTGRRMDNGRYGMKIYDAEGREIDVNDNAMSVFSQYLHEAGCEKGLDQVFWKADDAAERAERVGILYLAEDFMKQNHIQMQH